jgi:5-oxoprolinase (ATP-hydrolysing) subunit B
VIRPFGEAALLVELPSLAAVHALTASLDARPIAGILEAVPGLETLLVELDPAGDADPTAIARELEARASAIGDTPTVGGRHRAIPVVYGGEFGPDLEEVARLTGLEPSDVTRRHAATEFSVEVLGFAPGWAYLGGLPAELEVPRLATPRTTTPPGSVAIAGPQTGIYPAALPGGWRVIGRTPITLFDPMRDPPAYFAPGDRVRFEPIDDGDWDARSGAPSDW